MSLDKIKEFLSKSILPKEIQDTLIPFFESYQQATGIPFEELWERYIFLLEEEQKNPTPFSHLHLLERWPHDYYAFGLDMVRPLIDWKSSYVKGEENLKKIIDLIEHGENVILLSNHQTEIDPQIISLLVQPFSETLASSMIFIAGHRVTSDPLAIPFSKGRNLLCIHSKKYIEHPPEKKQEKLIHNATVMSKLEELLNQGGMCVYVAPSGGRDRYNEKGEAQVSPFDSQSLEMFSLLVKKSEKPVHLFPLALYTVHLLPPPQGVNIEIGEERNVAYGPCRLFFGPEVDLESYSDNPDRKLRRQEKSDRLTNEVMEMYEAIKG